MISSYGGYLQFIRCGEYRIRLWCKYGLRVVNVSNPAAMVGIGTFTSGTVNFQGIDIVGNTAFLARKLNWSDYCKYYKPRKYNKNKQL